MKFSVLMSVYYKDNPIFFKQALESISIEQTLKPNQIVIVYDGETPKEIDSIIEITKKKTPNIEYTIIKNKVNKGLAYSLNKGLKNCKYDWIARMDSDDISVKDRFEKQIKYLKIHNKIEVLGGSIEEFKNRPGDLKSFKYSETNKEKIKNILKRRNPINHMTVIYKKSMIENVGGYSLNYGKLEDYKLWVDLIYNNIMIENLKDILVKVRVGNGFLERRSNKQEIKDWDKLQEYLIEKKMINKFRKLKNKLNIRVFIYMPIFFKKIVYKLFLRGSR